MAENRVCSSCGGQWDGEATEQGECRHCGQQTPYVMALGRRAPLCVQCEGECCPECGSLEAS